MMEDFPRVEFPFEQYFEFFIIFGGILLVLLACYYSVQILFAEWSSIRKRSLMESKE